MKKVLIFIDNHFDITWRRCFDREFTWKDDTFVSYAEIEDYYITDNLMYAETIPGYRFQIESTAVIRKYLERHPEKQEYIKKYLKNGTIYIPFSGDNIIDTNMTHGETIVRNYVLGKLWMEKHLNFSPDICTRNDAFGNCGQIPQIVNGCDGSWVTAISYCPLNGDIWEGLDGSRLKYLDCHFIGHGGGFVKYPPCPECHGDAKERVGCKACDGRGIDLEHVKHSRFGIHIQNPEILEKDGWGVLPYGGEEILPNEDIFNWIEEHKEKYDISFATMPIIRSMGKMPGEPKVFSGDLNPSSTGCFVSRIKTKQLLRKAEYSMLNAELLGVMAMLKGWKYPKKKAEKIWENILFAAFHDSVTGTHIDACYEELMDCFAEIQCMTDEIKKDALLFLNMDANKVISIINPTGNYATEVISVPFEKGQVYSLKSESGEEIKPCAVTGEVWQFVISHMKPYEIRRYELVKANEPKVQKLGLADSEFAKTGMIVLQGGDTLDESFGVAGFQETIENSRYRIIADTYGILEIYDKKLGQVLSKETEYRPGEWILEHDEGSPWTTLSDDRRRFRLAPFTKLTEKEVGDGYARLCFKTVPPMHYGYGIDGIVITTTVTLYEGLDRVEFADDVKWDTMNHRLRFAMPVCAKGKTLYEVPYGFMERKPYYEPSKEENYIIGWNAANGDWSAINWSGVSGEEFSIALMNRGLPSYIIENDMIFLSVLRSPGVPICLHEGRAYTMLDFDGMRDSGMHHHEFALSAYACPLPESTIVEDADCYQAGLIYTDGIIEDMDMPYVVEGVGIRISSVKPAEDMKGIVIRVVETAGNYSKSVIHIPSCFKSVYETNMLERKEALLDLVNSKVEVYLEAFKIKTLVCRI